MQQVWLLVFASHAAIAAVWWWLMPHGFPTWATAYWVNEVLPFVVVATVAAALLASGKLALAIVPPIHAMFPLFWMAWGISMRLTFPVSSGSMWNIAFFAGFALAMMWMKQHRFHFGNGWIVPVFVVPALWLGWWLPGTQRADDSATTPSKEALYAVTPMPRSPELIKLTKDAQLHTDDGRLVVQSDKLVLTVQPLLSFADRSPDRFYTELSPRDENRPTKRRLSGIMKDGAHFKLAFTDEDKSVLEVGLRDGAIELDARSHLPTAIFSHLNQFAEVTLRGHTKATVAFSPLPTMRFETPSPGGPLRFAYLDETGMFHVAEAANHDTGPFTELASAPVKRGEPLTMTLYDGETPQFRLAFHDWVAEASAKASPSAGWGVTASSIIWARVAEPAAAPMAISLSLASTDIGRGSRSVGHAEGVYRDRITVSALHAMVR